MYVWLKIPEEFISLFVDRVLLVSAASARVLVKRESGNNNGNDNVGSGKNGRQIAKNQNAFGEGNL